MSKSAKEKLTQSKLLLDKNPYVKALYTKYKNWTLDEEEVLTFKGRWRQDVFQTKEDTALDVEIGPGNGEHFAFLAERQPQRYCLAVELKYKPIIQTARRIKAKKLFNGKVIRYNARLIDQVFSFNEINNVYIHFPDPWPKKRHHKHRLINSDFLQKLYNIQRAGSFVEIKTDGLSYFKEMEILFKDSLYRLQSYSQNLHEQGISPAGAGGDADSLTDKVYKKDSQPKENQFPVMTFFEQIFARKKQPVYYAKYIKRS